VRRSSRVILLLGIFLAVGAFILILFLNGGGQPRATPTPAVAHLVVAAVDIPQGTKITESMLSSTDVPLTEAPGDSFALAASVVGKTAREGVAAGAYVAQSAITGAGGTIDVAAELKPGERGMALQVDEVSGVGTLIQPGDRVDVIVGISKSSCNGAQADCLPVGFLFPLDSGKKTVPEVPNPNGVPAPQGPAGSTGFQVITPDEINATTVKVAVQNARVIAILLPPPAPTQQGGAEASPTPTGPALVSGTYIVIVAVSAQAAELLRFAQMEGTITMALRSTGDAEASPDTTTGIVLRSLIDIYGFLPPRLVVTENKGQ
jgi:Flp pilus assembly protein CpaB